MINFPVALNSLAGGDKLYSMIQEAVVGLEICRTYRVDSLFEVGGQGILFKVSDLSRYGTTAIIKMPFLNYQRSAYLEVETIRQEYNFISNEALIMWQFSGTIFPEIYDFFESANPLLTPLWAETLKTPCPFLVMEFIHGRTLDQEIVAIHKSQKLNPKNLEQLAWQISFDILDLFAMLYQQNYLYTDMRPVNVLLADQQDRRGQADWLRRHRPVGVNLPPAKVDTFTRVIDVGSVVQEQIAGTVWPWHLAYVPPEYFDCILNKTLVPKPNVHFVLYTLGKTLYELLMAKAPVAGMDPDFNVPGLHNFSHEIVEFLHVLIHDVSFSFENARLFAHRKIQNASIKPKTSR